MRKTQPHWPFKVVEVRAAKLYYIKLPNNINIRIQVLLYLLCGTYVRELYITSLFSITTRLKIYNIIWYKIWFVVDMF